MELFKLMYDTKHFKRATSPLYKKLPLDREVVILCIGTDKVMGDSIGPRVGSKLTEAGHRNIYGTMCSLVHAMNLKDVYEEILNNHDEPYIIAVDASIGKPENKGKIIGKKEPLAAGSGVGKNLGLYGDLSLVGIVCEVDINAFRRLMEVPESYVETMSNRMFEIIDHAMNKRNKKLIALAKNKGE